MKTFLFILLFSTLSLFFLNDLSAQGVSINEDGVEADASAMLDIKSTTKGMLIPRMTYAEMMAITSPAEGLMVYCNSFDNFYYHDGTSWVELSGGTDEDWIADGDNLYSNNSGLIGIGTSTTLPTHKLTIENSDNNNVLRLIGTGTFGEYARFSFGDGDYAYIEEFFDDKLLMNANSGLALTSNYDIEVVSGFGNVQIYTAEGGASIKDDTSPRDPSAVLDVNSSDKGILIPRMTTEQISGISEPADGLQVYNTSESKLYIYVASANAWKELSYGTGIIVVQTFETCGDDLADIRDGKSYATVEINGQCWMADNLNYGTMITTGYSQSNNGTPEKYCLNNSTTFCDNIGGLYQWNEMMNYTTTAGAQGLCPDGWHVPTDTEWFAMENFLDPTISNPTQTGWRGSVAGMKLKNAGSGPPYNWNSGNAGTNESGFTALPSGYRNTSGGSSGTATNAAFWTSTQYYDRELFYGYNTAYRGSGVNPYFGFAVRCIKD